MKGLVTVASMVRLWAREVIKKLGEVDEVRDWGGTDVARGRRIERTKIRKLSGL